MAWTIACPRSSKALGPPPGPSSPALPTPLSAVCRAVASHSVPRPAHLQWPRLPKERAPVGLAACARQLPWQRASRQALVERHKGCQQRGGHGHIMNHREAVRQAGPQPRDVPHAGPQQRHRAAGLGRVARLVAAAMGGAANAQEVGCVKWVWQAGCKRRRRSVLEWTPRPGPSLPHPRPSSRAAALPGRHAQQAPLQHSTHGSCLVPAKWLRRAAITLCTLSGAAGRRNGCE